MAHARPQLTEAEYLAIERKAETRSEFLNGEMFAMSGASLRHNVIAGNIFASLWTALRGRGCTVFASDMRVRVAASGLYAYPDVGVVCGELDMADETFDTLTNPILLVEVLSKSTASYDCYDLGEKFGHYRALESLQEALFVDQATAHVVHFLRQDDGSWRLTETRDPEGKIVLPDLQVELETAVIYEGIEFDRSVGGNRLGPVAVD